MGSYIIEGRSELNGIVEISGSKNSALPVLASTVLDGREYIIRNVPDIRDVRMMLEILKSLECKVKFEDGIVEVDTSNLNTHVVPEMLVKKIRSSIILMGAMLARTGRVDICYPGGCEIGLRPIDLHLKGLKKLGIKIKEQNGMLNCSVNDIIGCDLHLDYPSVGATENIMLASVGCKGKTVIKNAAKEPEILDLQKFLNHCGYDIKGAGTSTVVINGKKIKDKGSIEYKIMSDRIEAGTFLAAAASTESEILIKNINRNHISSLISILDDSGCEMKKVDKDLFVKRKNRLKSAEIIRTQPYPGFPTDMQAQIMAAYSVAKGTTIIKETVFENRFKQAAELIKMGADIKVIGRAAVINGVEKLHGAEVSAKDLRGGAALVIAGISAEGTTKINNIYHVNRGYENFVSKLKKLGVKIKESHE